MSNNIAKRQYTLKKGDPQNIQWLDAHWFQSDQADERRQSFGDPIAQFPLTFGQTGWSMEGNTHLIALSDEESERAVGERAAYIEMLYARAAGKPVTHPPGTRDTAELSPTVVIAIPDEKKPVVASLKDVADWLVQIGFADPKNAPRYKGNSTYRRGYALPVSVYSWVRNAPPDEYRKPEEFSIIGTLVDYGTGELAEVRSVLDRLKENAQEGRSQYTDADYVGAAVKLVAHGYTEAQLSDAIWGPTLRTKKRGIVQRVHPLAILANRYPALNIPERVTRSRPMVEIDGKFKPAEFPVYEKGGYIPFGSLLAADLRTLKGGAPGTFEPSELAKQAFIDVKGTYTDGQPADDTVFERYVELLMSGRKTAERAMSMKKASDIVASAREGSPTAELVKAIASNGESTLASMVSSENRVLDVIKDAPKDSIVAKTVRATLRRDDKAIAHLLKAEATTVETEVATPKRSAKQTHAKAGRK